MMRVVKIGGRVQADLQLAAAIASAWQDAPGTVCFVHGGGDEVGAAQKSVGTPPSFVGGRRVTTEADLNILRMVLSGSANKRLVSALVAEGLDAVGISGEDAGLLVARVVDDPELGLVGEPERVNTKLLLHLLSGGYLPIVSPVSCLKGSTRGGALNVNGDDAAAAIAVALGAGELLFVGDVPGVIELGSVIVSLDPATVYGLVARGTATGGMIAKLHAGLRAVEQGVGSVRIGDIDCLANPDRGTTIHAELCVS
ncbi:MAG: acetylglutamate kinase [Gemmatimonadaceae bacterium]